MNRLNPSQIKAYSDLRSPLRDGNGLYLKCSPSGVKSFRWDYRFAGKRKTLTYGQWPAVSLQDARKLHSQAKAVLAEGRDPAVEKKTKRHKDNSFEGVALDWWHHYKATWSKPHAERVWGRLKQNAMPLIGGLPIDKVRPRDVISVIRDIERRGSLDVASRILQAIRAIFRFAIQEGRIDQNPIVDVTSEILKPRNVTHRPSLNRDELPQFLRDLESYHEQGRLLTQLAAKLLVLTFVRSGELRGARWSEFDIDGKLWRVPPERMKMKNEHLVPLSRQAVEVIEKIREITGGYELLFPSGKDRFKCMSDNTLRMAFFRMGYDGKTPGKSKCVPHGIRATASSLLNESGWNPDAIERQLAHKESNSVRAAYTHHARYLDERAKMMQWWADMLDQMREGAAVVPFRKNG